MTIGTRLARLREAAGMSRYELMRRTGLSYQTLLNIESGAVRRPNHTTIDAIARALAPRLGRSTADVLAELMGEEVEHAGAH